MKNIRQRIVYPIALLVIILANTIIPVYKAFAERANPNIDERTIQNTLETLTTEARAAHAAHVFYNCFSLSVNSYFTDDWKGTKVASDPAAWMIGSGTQGGTRGVGAWLEAKVAGGDPDDGAIYCDENDVKLLDVLAGQLGTTASKLLCGPGGTPGLFYKTDKAGECDVSSDARHRMNATGWSAYLGSVYDAYAEQKNWKYRWSDVGSDGWVYPDVIGYTMYVAEVDYGCGRRAGSTKPASNYIEPAVKSVNEKGEITDDWYYGNGSAYVVPGTAGGIASGWHHHAFVTRAQDATCSQMVEFANEKSSYFQQEIFQLIKDGCEAAYKQQYDKAKEEVAKDGISDENKEKLNNAIAEYEAMKNSGSFTEPTENGGLQCKDTQYLATVTQTQWTDTDNPDPGTDAEGDPTCYDQAGSLGWIVCPITTGLADVIQKVYESLIVPFLKFEPKLFATSENGGNNVYMTWTVFQGIANIAFFVIFLIVIFSQITGYGIDNYGIKKILPKLIVCALLINTSYIICQAAIDLGNILGAGIGGIFTDLATRVQIQAVATDVAPSAAQSIGSVVGVFLVAAIAGALVVGAVLTQGLGVIIPILLGLLSIVIAIVFLFILLSIRQALAVILVVLSPIAFVCYMLPNTKQVFTRWFNTFKGLLLAYPICSAMIYGGQAIGMILIAANGSGTGTVTASTEILLSAAVISIVPIFLIPGVLKKSMGAITGMVARAQGAVRRPVMGGAAHALDRSRLGMRRAYNMHKYEQGRAARMGEYNYNRAGKALNKMRDSDGNIDVASMNAKQRRAYNVAMGQVGAHNAEMRHAHDATFANMGSGAIAGQLGTMLDGGADKFDENMLSSGLAALDSQGQYGDLNNVLKSVDLASMSPEQQRSFATQLAGLKNADPIAAAYGKHILKGGKGSFEDFIKTGQNGDFGDRMRDLGRNALANADDSTIQWINDYNNPKDGPAKTGNERIRFSTEQIAAAAGADLSTKQQRQFSTMVSRMEADERQDVASSMKAGQVASMSAASAAALSGTYDANSHTYTMNGEAMQRTFGAQAAELASAENAGLRAGMDNEVKAALGLDNLDNGGGTPAPTPAPTNGGGGAPAPSGDSNPIVHTEHTSQGDINIRRNPDHPGEYRTDSGIILQGSTVDNMRRNSGGDSSSTPAPSGDGGGGTPTPSGDGGGSSTPPPTPSGNSGSNSSQPHPVPAGGDGGSSHDSGGGGPRGGGSHNPAGGFHGGGPRGGGSFGGPRGGGSFGGPRGGGGPFGGGPRGGGPRGGSGPGGMILPGDPGFH